MKNSITLLMIIGFTAFSQAQHQVQIDTAKSNITWTGSNLFKFNKHYGTVKFKNGTLRIENDTIRGGHFIVDMYSIMNTDGKYNEMLVDHLKQSDFFYVEKYPSAKLEILEVHYLKDHIVEFMADLTIKQVTKPITFRSSIEHRGSTLGLRSKFIIDRTRWGITYESKGILGSAKDGIISDAIELVVELTAKLPL